MSQPARPGWWPGLCSCSLVSQEVGCLGEVRHKWWSGFDSCGRRDEIAGAWRYGIWYAPCPRSGSLLRLRAAGPPGPRTTGRRSDAELLSGTWTATPTRSASCSCGTRTGCGRSRSGRCPILRMPLTRLQDAMISAFRRADSFRGESAVTTWLHRIVVNACLDKMRAGAPGPRSAAAMNGCSTRSRRSEPGVDPATSSDVSIEVAAALQAAAARPAGRPGAGGHARLPGRGSR